MILADTVVAGIHTLDGGKLWGAFLFVCSVSMQFTTERVVYKLQNSAPFTVNLMCLFDNSFMMWPLFSVQLCICLSFKLYCKSCHGKSFVCVCVFSLYTLAVLTQTHSCWLLKFSQKDIKRKMVCVRSVFVCACVSFCFHWPAVVFTALKALLCFVMCGSCPVMSMTP